MNQQLFERLGDAAPAFGPMAVSAVAMLLGAWLVVYPAGWFVAWSMRSKKDKLTSNREDEHAVLPKSARGFPDGGEAIGRLERLLIYLLVMSGELGGVGFLVAAKSIFRFGELSDQNNRLEAEYITIGTLMSFTVGLVIAIASRSLLPFVRLLL